jgi:hypothetical protein
VARHFRGRDHRGRESASSIATGAASDVTASLSEAVTPYDVDRLLRAPGGEKETSRTDARAEVTRILAKGFGMGDVSAEDREYLVKLVADRTGVSTPEAQKRVDDAIATGKQATLRARQAADEARKAGVMMSIFMALSMLIGAFIASASAALGGRLRDL